MANICPHCHEAPCLPVRRKLTMGAMGSARCLCCDGKVGLAFGPAMASMLAIWLLLLGLLLLILVRLALAEFEPNPVPVSAMLIVLLALATALAVHWFGVKLRKDEISSAQTVALGKARMAARRKSG